MSTFFPTENHLVICCAHERKASGHLKVGPHLWLSLTIRFPFFKHRSQIIDSFLSTSLSSIPPCRLIPLFSLSVSLPLCCSAEFVRGSEFGSPLNLVSQQMSNASSLCQCLCECVCKHVGMCTHASACAHGARCCSPLFPVNAARFFSHTTK